MVYNKVIIHDLMGDDLNLIPTATDDCYVVDANAKASHCVGCFGCWLKTPGICVLKDEFQHLGVILPQSKEIIIISQGCYGGYSPNVKKVLDRSIALSLPFFYLSRLENAPYQPLQKPTELHCIYVWGNERF